MKHLRVVAAAVTLLLLTGAGCISLGGNKTSTGSGPLGVFVSTDKGENWQHISILPTAKGPQVLSDVSVYRLAADSLDPRALYWQSRAQGLFYSYNEGRTWQHPEDGPFTSGFVYSVAVHPNDSCTIYATNGQLVYRTVDCSRSWTEVYRESRGDTIILSLVFNPGQPHQIFLTESGGAVLQSKDAGRSWQVVRRFDVPLLPMNSDPLQPNNLYVITRRNGMHVSTDLGRTWTSREENFENFSDALEFRRFLLHPTKKNVMYWVSTYGILRSPDAGVSWEEMKLITPPGSAQIYGFAINPQNDKEIYYTATINGRSTFYRSEDGGVNWITKQVPSGQLPTVLYVHPTKANIIYLGFSEVPKQ